MAKFVYVFDKAAKEKMLAAGYTLLKDDPRSDTYVFLWDERMSFSNDFSYTFSNTLTF